MKQFLLIIVLSLVCYGQTSVNCPTTATCGNTGSAVSGSAGYSQNLSIIPLTFTYSVQVTGLQYYLYAAPTLNTTVLMTLSCDSNTSGSVMAAANPCPANNVICSGTDSVTNGTATGWRTITPSSSCGTLMNSTQFAGRYWLGVTNSSISLQVGAQTGGVLSYQQGDGCCTPPSSITGGTGGSSGLDTMLAVTLSAYTYTNDYTLTLGSATYIPSTQSNYPMLVCANGSAGCAGTFNFNNTSSSGYDIIFSTTTCSGSNLSKNTFWEMPNAPSTGTSFAEFWVYFPSLVAAGTIHVCTGSSGPTAFQGGITGSAWGSIGTWHLSNGSTLSASDASKNSNNGTISGATATAGQVNGAAALLTASSEYIGNSSGFPTSWTTVTVSAWFNATSLSSTNTIFYSSQGTSGWGSFIRTDSHPEWVERGVADNSFTSLTVTAGHTYYMAMTHSGTSVTCYLYDATSSTSANQTVTVTDTSYSTSGGWYIGRIDLGFYFGGWIDEVEVYFSALSANWIATDYNCQFNNANCVIFPAVATCASGAHITLIGVGCSDEIDL